MAQSPCSFLALAPFSIPLYLLGNPPCCDRIRPPWSQVADKLSPQWVPQVNGEGVRCSLWAHQVKGPTPCSSGYISATHQSLLHCTLSPAIHFNGSNGTTYTRPSKVQNTNLPSSIFSICQQFLALSAIFSCFSHFQLSAYHKKKGEGDIKVGWEWAEGWSLQDQL